MNKEITMGDLFGEDGGCIINYSKVQKAKKEIAMHPATSKGIPLYDLDLNIIWYESD